MGLPDNLSSLKVDELRDECDERGIPFKGKTKDDMREAIVQFEKDESDTFDSAGESRSKGVDERSEITLLKMRLEHEYRMRQLELASHEREREFSLQNNDFGVNKSPKLPSFKEGEDVEVYLGMFERIARANKWNANTWAPRLAALLTGKAREAYVRMNLIASGDYHELCAAIRERYDLTPDAYRRKFRSSRKLSDETFKEWGIRARRLFERWMSCDITSANAICEQMIMEQILDNTSPDLQLCSENMNLKQ